MQEAWWFERKAGGEGALNPHHKKRDIPFHLSVEGVHLSIHGGQVLS